MAGLEDADSGSPEIGLWLKESAHGQGFGREVVAALVVVHTTTYLAVTGLIAWVVYRKLGLGLLRKTWLNFNLIWGVALVITGLFTLFIA